MSLVKWAVDNASALEVVTQRRDADKAMVDRALDIVRRFIIERRLILFGGLAIDYALRLKGSYIYDKDKQPDFDFFSTQNVDDAYDLVDIFAAAGFTGASAVRGIHVQTMRVRIDFVWVADIGYAPPDVFDTIPTFEYQSMRVAHPDYQRMDQHLAFCFPFNGAPREDIFSRWKKDLTRFNLFEQYYPIMADGGAAAAAAGTAATVVTATALIDLVAEDPATLTIALHGFAAYAVIRVALDELVAAAGAAAADAASIKAPRLALSFTDAKSFTVEVPSGAAPLAHLVCYEPDLTKVLPAPVEQFWPYMDLQPESAQSNSLVVWSVASRKIAASAVEVAAAAGGGGIPSRTNVVTPQYLLLFFMFESFRAKTDAARAVYRDYYAYTLEVIAAAEKICAAAGEAGARLFAMSPFAPTVRTIGTVNHDAAYLIKVALSATVLQDTPPAVLAVSSDIKSRLEGLPTNYYFNNRQAFDYNACAFFKRSGERR